jgi:MFS family permease
MVRRTVVDDPRGGFAIRRPQTVLALLTALNLLNYVDRTVLSAVLAPVQDDLHLTNLVAGWLPTIFLIGYFGTSPVFGSLGDRSAHRGRMRLIAIGIAVWSAATVASGFAQGAGSLVVARAFVGVGEASYAAIAPTIIDDFAPKEKKSQWLGIFYAAIPIGSALGYLVGGTVLRAHGWRAAFFVAGGPGLAVALLCLLIAEPASLLPSFSSAPPPARSEDGGPAAGGLFQAAASLASIALYRSTVLGYCAYTFALGGFAYWAPAYLHRQYGIEAGHASVVFGLITVAGGFGGTLLGGALGDRLTRTRVARAQGLVKEVVSTASSSSYRESDVAPAPLDPRALDDVTARANLSLAALGAGLGAPLAALALVSADASGFFKAVFPAQIALFLLSGPINVAILRSAPPALRTSAMALSTFAIHALGDFWSPLIIGLVADHAPMRVAMYAAPLVFALASFVWWRGGAASARLT